jgi:hypothetical protein
MAAHAARFTNGGTAYGRLAQTINQTVVCPITSIDGSEVKSYFEWIKIPYGVGKSHAYILDGEFGLINYLKKTKEDPQRIFRNLVPIEKRMTWYMKMTPEEKLIQITSIYRDNLFLNTIEDFKNPPERRGYRNFGVILGLDVFEKYNYIIDVDAGNAGKLLNIHKDRKPIIIRKSSVSAYNENACFTVFSISYLANSEVWHVRFVNVHGVGIYLLSRFTRGDISRTFNIDAPNLIDKPIKDVLEQLDYQPPSFVCLTEILEEIEKNGHVNLTNIIRGTTGGGYS